MAPAALRSAQRLVVREVDLHYLRCHPVQLSALPTNGPRGSQKRATAGRSRGRSSLLALPSGTAVRTPDEWPPRLSEARNGWSFARSIFITCVAIRYSCPHSRRMAPAALRSAQRLVVREVDL